MMTQLVQAATAILGHSSSDDDQREVRVPPSINMANCKTKPHHQFLAPTAASRPYCHQRREIPTTSAFCPRVDSANVQDNRFFGVVVLTGDDDKDEKKKRSSCSSIASSIRTSTEDNSSISAMDIGKLQAHEYGDDDDEVFQTFTTETNRRRKTIGNRPSARDSYSCWSPSLRTIAGHQKLGPKGQFSVAKGFHGVSPPHIGHHDIVKVASRLLNYTL